MRSSLIFESFAKVLAVVAIGVAVIVSVIWIYLLFLSVLSIIGGMGYNLNSYSDFVPIVFLGISLVLSVFGTVLAIKFRQTQQWLSIILSLAVTMSSFFVLYGFLRLFNQ